MIYFNFKLCNPFSKRFDIAHTYTKKLTENKSFEFNVYRTNDIIELNFDLSTWGSHAGIRLQIALLGYSVEAHIYDNRHWDYEKNEYETTS